MTHQMGLITASGCGRVSRRQFLVDTGMGFTGLALSAMLASEAAGESDAAPVTTAPSGLPHRAPRARAVIWIFLCGGVSHLESFDIKPILNQYAGKSIDETPYSAVLDPAKIQRNLVGINPSHGSRKVLMPLQTGFRTYGESG